MCLVTKRQSTKRVCSSPHSDMTIVLTASFVLYLQIRHFVRHERKDALPTCNCINCMEISLDSPYHHYCHAFHERFDELAQTIQRSNIEVNAKAAELLLELCVDYAFPHIM